MVVEELIELLQQMPKTAVALVVDGLGMDEDDQICRELEGVVYEHGTVYLLIEKEADDGRS